jgi:hypothetical protein
MDATSFQISRSFFPQFQFLQIQAFVVSLSGCVAPELLCGGVLPDAFVWGAFNAGAPLIPLFGAGVSGGASVEETGGGPTGVLAAWRRASSISRCVAVICACVESSCAQRSTTSVGTGPETIIVPERYQS